MDVSPPSSPRAANSGGEPVPGQDSPTGDSPWRGRQVTRPLLLPGATNLTRLASHFSMLTGKPWEERDVALPLLFAGGCESALPRDGGILFLLCMEKIAKSERLSCLLCITPFAYLTREEELRERVLYALSLFPREDRTGLLVQLLSTLCRETSFLNQLSEVKEAQRAKWCYSFCPSRPSSSCSRPRSRSLGSAI